MERAVKPVYIEWWDPYGHDRAGWKPLSEALVDGGICKSLGFIIKDDKKFITLAGTTAVDDGATSVLGYITIPKSVIRKMKVLKL
jgi:hypothetical protein